MRDPLVDSQPHLAAGSGSALASANAVDCVCRAIAKGLTRAYFVDLPDHAPLLDEIDQLLERAAVLARRDGWAEAICRRFDNHVLVLVGQYSEFDWVIPAVKKRIGEAVATLSTPPRK